MKFEILKRYIFGFKNPNKPKPPFFLSLSFFSFFLFLSFLSSLFCLPSFSRSAPSPHKFGADQAFSGQPITPTTYLVRAQLGSAQEQPRHMWYARPVRMRPSSASPRANGRRPVSPLASFAPRSTLQLNRELAQLKPREDVRAVRHPGAPTALRCAVGPGQLGRTSD